MPEIKGFKPPELSENDLKIREKAKKSVMNKLETLLPNIDLKDYYATIQNTHDLRGTPLKSGNVLVADVVGVRVSRNDLSIALKKQGYGSHVLPDQGQDVSFTVSYREIVDSNTGSVVATQFSYRRETTTYRPGGDISPVTPFIEYTFYQGPAIELYTDESRALSGKNAPLFDEFGAPTRSDNPLRQNQTFIKENSGTGSYWL